MKGSKVGWEIAVRTAEESTPNFAVKLEEGAEDQSIDKQASPRRA